MNARADRERRDRTRWLFFFIALLLLSVLCLAMSLFYPPWWSGSGSRWIPVGLRSVLKADYSADASVASLPQVGIGLIANAINDQPEASGLPERMATVVGNLQTPVPTVTPYIFGPGTATPGLAATPTLPGPAPTRAQASATPGSTQGPHPTLTLTQTLIVYFTPTSSPAGGETPIGPTSTPRPHTSTPVPPTATSRPPTSTSAPPTHTPLPPPTSTPKPPPTNTPEPPYVPPPANTPIPPTSYP